MVPLFFHLSYQKTLDKVLATLTGEGYTFITSTWLFLSHLLPSFINIAFLGLF